MNTTIRPFRLAISEEQLADLRRRLVATRWPQPVVQDFSHGQAFKVLESFRKYAGYVDIQSRRPGTLAYGLVDSPSALLAWNAELFFGFEGERVAEVDRDRFLTHVSLYWFTATGGQAAEMYLANAASGAGYRELPNRTPTAVAVFPDDFRSVRRFAARSHTRLVQWTEMPRGGHFANETQPQLVVDDLRRFFGAMQTENASHGTTDH